MADNIPVTPGTGANVATDDVAGVHFQKVKLDLGGDGASVPVTAEVPVKEKRAAISAVTSVAASTTFVALLAANAARLGAAIHNDSTAVLYVKLGAAASATSFTVKMAADSYYEVPFAYTGVIDGVWASAAGAARVTELS